MIRRQTVNFGGDTLTIRFDYDTKPLTSIYDLNVPRDAPVVKVPSLANKKAGTPVARNQPATMGRDELSKLVESSRGQIQSLEVTFTERVTEPRPDEASNFAHITAVVKGNKTYIDKRFTFGITRETEHQRIVVFDGKRTAIYIAQTRSAVVSDGRSRETHTQGLGFFDLNLLNSPRREVTGGDAQSLEQLLQDRRVKIRPRLETIGDRAWHVAETDRFTVWLDTERGGLPMRHELRESADSPPTMIFVVDKTVKASPGLWLATRGRKIVPAQPGLPSAVGGLQQVIVAESESGKEPVRLNAKIVDERFDLLKSLPDGTTWRDQGRSGEK